METELNETVDPEVCGNCSRIFNAKQGRAATKRFIYKGISQGIKIEASVAMWKAVIEIYNLKSLGIWSKGGCALELDKELALCQICGLALAKLYSSWKVFIELQETTSYLHEVIGDFSNEFAKLVNETEEFGADPSTQPIVTEDQDSNELPTDMLGTKWTSGSRKSTRRVTPKKFLYEGTVMGQRDEIEDDARDVDYHHPPGAQGTSGTQKPLQYYTSLSLQDEFPDPLSQISKELFTIEYDPDEPPKEYPLKEHLCQICATGFDKASNLKRHLLLSHEVGERTKDFVCNICGKAYYFGYLLKNHQISHSVERPAECPICKATFKSKDSLLHHTRDVHRNEEDPRLKCKYCQKQFRQIRCLNEHVLMIHRFGKGKKLVACNRGCGAMFKRKKSMLGHVRNNQCRARDPRSARKRELKMKRPDEGVDAESDSDGEVLDLQYHCPFQCNAAFTTHSLLSSHIRMRCPKNPESSSRLRPTRTSTRTRKNQVLDKSDEEEEEETVKESDGDEEGENEPTYDDDEPLEEFPEPSEEEEVPEFNMTQVKTEDMEDIAAENVEDMETIVAENVDVMTEEEIGGEQLVAESLEEIYDDSENQQCYEITEIYEVQELPEGVHVQELQAGEFLQYGTFQIHEEMQ